MLDLDPGRQYYASEATAISDAGAIVGFGNITPNAPSTAVRFADSKIIMLAGEVSNLGDWQLVSATGINAAGVIVGKGVHNDAGHAFMLVPQ
jgi:hypothetical protein